MTTSAEDRKKHGEQGSPVCVTCGCADNNLSRPGGRCWSCIVAGSEAWSEAVAAARDAVERVTVVYDGLGPDPTFDELLFAGRVAPNASSKRPKVRYAQPREHVRRRLAGLIATVVEACPGERNVKLHWAACRAGELVASGELDEDVAVALLQDAAATAGLRPSEFGDATRGTIASGMRGVAR